MRRVNISMHRDKRKEYGRRREVGEIKVEEYMSRAGIGRELSGEEIFAG